jgi:hypothetical protein
MFSASCLDRFFVSWTAHTGFAAGRETTLMYISEYTIDPATSQATFISDKEFSYCTEPGQIYVSSDCNVVSVLCRSPHEAAAIGAYDFVNQTITDHIVNNVGQTCQTSPRIHLIDESSDLLLDYKSKMVFLSLICSLVVCQITL